MEVDKEELLKPRRLGKEVARLQKGMGLRVNDAKIIKESVSRKDFPDYSKKSLTSRERVEYQKIPKVMNTNFHYMTMAQNDYVKHPIQADHRHLRKQYDRNSKLL